MKIISKKTKDRIVSNIFSLSALQAANYIFPLLSIPYLVRILGPDYFGLVSLANAMMVYFILITDYGFNLSATRQISLYRDNVEKVNEIFSCVMITKSVLLLFCFIVFLLTVLTFEMFRQNLELYFVSFGMVVGQTIFPVWLFQGMEKMKYIAYLNIFSKLFFLICIFIFVTEQSDFILVPLLTSLGYLLAGVWSLYLVRSDLNVAFKWQGLRKIKLQIKEGWHLFISTAAVSFYTTSITFVLGIFTNSSTVGYYVASEKIINAVKALFNPISQAVYPFLSSTMNKNVKLGIDSIQSMVRIFGFGMLMVSTLIFLLAEPIVLILLGDKYTESIILLKILSFVPFFVVLSNIYGVQGMLTLGYKREFTKILIVVGILSIISSLTIVTSFKAVGVSAVVLVTEILIAFCMYRFVKKNIIKATN